MMDVLPWACLRPRCAAEPCPPTLSAGRSAGPTCITDPPARSADSPSHGSPGSASLPSVRWNQSTQEVRYFKNRWPQITALVEITHLSWMFFLTIRKYDLMSLSMTSQSLCSRAVNFLDTGTGWRRPKKTKTKQNDSRTYTTPARVNSQHPPHRAGSQRDSSVGWMEKGLVQQHSLLPSSTCPSSSPCLPRSARLRGLLL